MRDEIIAEVNSCIAECLEAIDNCIPFMDMEYYHDIYAEVRQDIYDQVEMWMTTYALDMKRDLERRYPDGN